MTAKVVIQLLQQGAVGRCYHYSSSVSRNCFVRITRVADDLFGAVVAYAEVLESENILDCELDGEEIEILDLGVLLNAHYDGERMVITAPFRIDQVKTTAGTP